MIKSVKLESPAKRAALLAAVLLCLAGAFFFAKWSFANTIAIQSGYNAERAAPKDLAELAVYLAPNDPQTHYALAVVGEKSFVMEDFTKSVAEYEMATALSPNDFRLWLALGKARERSGDAAGAEKALRKALELAPNYSEAQWTLGNALLRQGKTEEAFDEIRKSVVGDTKYVAPAVSTAWQILDGDLAQIKQNLGDSAALNSALALFLSKQKRFDEALQIWNALPENDRKTTFKLTGEELYREMIAAKKYRAALQLQNQAGAANPAVGKITNGGFEEKINPTNPSVFEWQIAEAAQPRVGPNDAQKHGGALSLLLIFNSSDGKDFRNISQVVAVEPGRKYNFEAFYKSDLKASATLKWEIADADGKVLATTAAVSANADWTSLKADFTAPENMDAVIIRLARDGCKSAICPISGSIWFDDFSIN
ncbi:MAG: tetratricopeptide repeat protein [Pyrinomonadaceae bacterium]